MKLLKEIILCIMTPVLDAFHLLDRACQEKKKKQLLKGFESVGKDVSIDFPFLINHQQNIVIGSHTTILANSRINLYQQNGKMPKVRIGEHCYIGYYFSLLAGADIKIGDNVLIASNVLITSENHSIDPESEISYMDQPLNGKSVNIGEGSWIGEKVCILSGVSIGKKCVIGAGSVVTKSIDDYTIAVGNPARPIKKYDFLQHKWIGIDS